MMLSPAYEEAFHSTMMVEIMEPMKPRTANEKPRSWMPALAIVEEFKVTSEIINKIKLVPQPKRVPALAPVWGELWVPYSCVYLYLIMNRPWRTGRIQEEQHVEGEEMQEDL